MRCRDHVAESCKSGAFTPVSKSGEFLHRHNAEHGADMRCHNRVAEQFEKPSVIRRCLNTVNFYSDTLSRDRVDMPCTPCVCASVRLSGGVLNRRGRGGACEQLLPLPPSKAQSTPDAARVPRTGDHARGVCGAIHSDLCAHAAHAMTSAQSTNARSIVARCTDMRYRLLTAPRFCVHLRRRTRGLYEAHQGPFV